MRISNSKVFSTVLRRPTYSGLNDVKHICKRLLTSSSSFSLCNDNLSPDICTGNVNVKISYSYSLQYIHQHLNFRKNTYRLYSSMNTRQLFCSPNVASINIDDIDIIDGDYEEEEALKQQEEKMNYLRHHLKEVMDSLNIKYHIPSGTKVSTTQESKEDEDYLLNTLLQDSRKNVTKMKLSYMKDLGKKKHPMEVEMITKQTYQELRIRLAHQIVRLYLYFYHQADTIDTATLSINKNSPSSIKKTKTLPLPESHQRAIQNLLHLHIHTYSELCYFGDLVLEDRINLKEFYEKLKSFDIRYASVIETLLDAQLSNDKIGKKSSMEKKKGKKKYIGKKRVEDMDDTVTYDSKELIDSFIKGKIGISVLIEMYTTFFKENEHLLLSHKTVVNSLSDNKNNAVERLSLMEPKEDEKDKNNTANNGSGDHDYKGSLARSINVESMIKDCIVESSILCERDYKYIPEVIISHERNDVQEPYDIVKWKEVAMYQSENIEKKLANSNNSPAKKYFNVIGIQSHLHYILFEVLKNALRASVEEWNERKDKFLAINEFTKEEHEEEEEEIEKQIGLPNPISVVLCEGQEESVIIIRDHGNGMSLKQMTRCFDYLYSSSKKKKKAYFDLQQTYQPVTEPLTGMGIGLPISQLYSRYFGGDIRIFSVQNYGTSVAIYIPRDVTIEENIPVSWNSF